MDHQRVRRLTVKTTIIIPNYNGMKYMENCIKALREETSTTFKILIVDNGSTDGSLQWIEENCPEAGLIKMGKNTGFCGAVNAGIRAAKTPYVLLLNNDTQVAAGFVRALEEALEEEKKAFSVSARMLDMNQPELLDGAGDLYCALGWAFARGKGKEEKKYYRDRAEIFSACAGAAIYRRQLVEKLGGFDENHFAYLEDCDLGWRAQLYGFRNYYTPKAVVYHAGSGVSGSRHNAFKVSLSSRNSIYLIYKNMPLWQILLNSPLLLCGYLIKLLFFLKKGLGGVYVKGCLEGIGLCTGKAGREKKQHPGRKNLGNILRIQGKLWGNTLRRFTG